MENKSRFNFANTLKMFLHPSLIIAFSFIAMAIIGSLLLFLPFSQNDGVSVDYIDCLFTSVSAICVTGLGTVDLATTYNIFGRIVILFLIQMGGLGVTTFILMILVLFGRKLHLSELGLIKQSFSIENFANLKIIFIRILLLTFSVEFLGAMLGVISFSRTMPLDQAFGVSFFHSISAFNNAGYDILGGFKGLSEYKNDIFLNLLTTFLIIVGGIGYLTIFDSISRKMNFKKFSLNTKIVYCTTACLLLFGMFFIKLSEGNNISWLGAWFTSVSTRTAGFATYNIGDMADRTLFGLMILQFIGAAPGSTGGGIKVTTFFVMLISIKSLMRNKPCSAFKQSISAKAVKSSFVIMFLGLTVITISSISISAIEGDKTIDGCTYYFIDHLFETVSAFGTVGLSTGFTPNYSVYSKLILCLLMYIGRMGPLTIATLGIFKERISSARYVEGNVIIG